MISKSHKISKADWDAVDSQPLSDKMLAKMRPVSEKHPDVPKRVRGSQKEPLKIPVSIRLNPDIIEYFKSQGKGWHTKINNILYDYMKTHNAKLTR
jgi:uncharacterized protein (DUF4415 family)